MNRSGLIVSIRALSVSCATLALVAGCPSDSSDPMLEDTSTDSGDGEPGDGDGDPTGDGDGDPTGDGDGDPGDGDGDPGCSQAGCACDPTDEEACDPPLYCDQGQCTAPECGNGEVEPGEQCEDLNRDDGDGCDNDCSFTEILYVDASYQNTCALI